MDERERRLQPEKEAEAETVKTRRKSVQLARKASEKEQRRRVRAEGGTMSGGWSSHVSAATLAIALIVAETVAAVDSLVRNCQIHLLSKSPLQTLSSNLRSQLGLSSSRRPSRCNVPPLG